MDYKNTLNLPKTDFPMKADLPNREGQFLQLWEKLDLYRLILEKSSGKQKYILHDGPPYANGDIHIGHALNKTLKDIIVKFKTMQGCSCSYVPGWDCHGLPVEHQLFKDLGINKYQINQLDFRKKAYEYALKFVEKQKVQFIRLGVFGDWQNPYLTLNPDYEEGIVKSLEILVNKGYVYRGLKPVNWCMRCETALAEAEVEYENHASPSIFVKFAIDNSDPRSLILDPRINENPESSIEHRSFFVIWTTTPWTLMANVAVSVHPDLVYCYVRTDKGNLIVAKDLLEQVLSRSGIEKYDLIKEFNGRQLEGLIYNHPFGLRKGKVVLADYVSREEGSGLVHTAPGHGMEDYSTGLKYKLDIVMPVNAKGSFDKSVPEYLQGVNVYDANKLILEKLQGAGALLWQGSIQHSYPHCWRCKKPVIFRATKQWFLKIDHDHLRERLLKEIKNTIKWVPSAGQERIASMVGLRPDWCLSRQRYWGVPIPSVVCNNCKEEILDPQIITAFAGFVSREGSDSWFKYDINDFLKVDTICSHCGKRDFSKGNDILDVWFDSGVSSQAVLKKRKELAFPADLYLEGSDQHRGWFQSSLIPAMCIDGIAPFKEVLTHGFVVDADGRKMSKSLGNVVSPFDITKIYGADILRLWVASSDYNEDIRISKEILSRLSEAYRKIRNTVRFILSNLYDFNPDSDKIGSENFKTIDKWILLSLYEDMLSAAKESYEKFEFYKAYKVIYDFCNEKLSTKYLDMVKGRLYTSAAHSKERRAAQSVMYEVLNCLVRAIAPILVFTAEEIWQNMPKGKNDLNVLSVHLLDWPLYKAGFIGDEKGLIDDFDRYVMSLIPEVSKALEEKRSQGVIGSSFDARIKLLTNDEKRFKYLSGSKNELCEVFKVSQVDISKLDTGALDFSIEVSSAEGKKCERCWNYSLSVSENTSHPLICASCIEAIGG